MYIIGRNNVYEMATIANGFKHANPINRQYFGLYNVYIIYYSGIHHNIIRIL